MAMTYHFKVGNGDMTLVALDSGRNVLIDINIRAAADDPADPTPDVAKQLRSLLARDAEGRLYVDAFLLTHPDEDHIRGLKKHFHLGPLDDYAPSRSKIVIKEMWSSPIIFRRRSRNFSLCEDAQAWAKEARRRANLFKQRGYAAEGDKILILGDDLPGKTDGLESIHVRPGQALAHVAGTYDSSFNGLLLGPMAIGSEEDEDLYSKNNSSVIMQLSLASGQRAAAGIFLFGGDAEVAIWERVWKANQFNPSNLQYDVLIAPHHCSWHSLSWDSWSELGEQAQISGDAKSALSQTRPGAVIVSSSNPVIDDNNDPPCIRAKREYVEFVEAVSGEFRCVGDVSGDGPLVTEITANGPKFLRVPVAKIAGATSGVGGGTLASRAVSDPKAEVELTRAQSRALRQAAVHPSIKGISTPEKLETGSLFFELIVYNELPAQWRAKGESPLGVRVQEKVGVILAQDYPVTSPSVFLRQDFPRHHPHIFPGKVNEFVRPCLSLGKLREVVQARGFIGMVEQIVDWFERAANFDLNDPRAGWEPMRRDTIDDFIAVDGDALRGRCNSQGGHDFSFMSYGNYRVSDTIRMLVHDDPTELKDYVPSLLEHNGEEDVTFGHGLALTAWPGSVDGKPIECPLYLPETVGTLDELRTRAGLYGCKDELERGLNELADLLERNPSPSAFPLAINLLARKAL